MANNPTDQLINAIMRVSMFGDDRDNLLARWNLLQASWGVGKAFYANGQQPVNLNSENPLCRFKAIGYSAISKPGAGGDKELLCIIIKKKPNEVEALKQQLITGEFRYLANDLTKKAYQMNIFLQIFKQLWEIDLTSRLLSMKSNPIVGNLPKSFFTLLKLT